MPSEDCLPPPPGTIIDLEFYVPKNTIKVDEKGICPRCGKLIFIVPGGTLLRSHKPCGGLVYGDEGRFRRFKITTSTKVEEI